MADMFDQQILSLITGILAGAVRSVQGWYESDEKFNIKLFLYTLIRTAIQGAAIGMGLNQQPLTVFFAVYFSDSLIVNPSIDKVKEKVVTK